MKKIALSAVGLALAGMSTLGLAAPTEMSVAQMDQVTAGSCHCPGNGGGTTPPSNGNPPTMGSLLNLAVVDAVDSNVGTASATNMAGFSFLSGQYAEAGNFQGNYSHNTVNQR